MQLYKYNWYLIFLSYWITVIITLLKYLAHSQLPALHQQEPDAKHITRRLSTVVLLESVIYW